MSASVVAPIDHLTRVVDGAYEDDFVVVRAITHAWPSRGRGSARTEHFDLVPRDGRLEVTHSVSRADIDDDLTSLVVDELFTPGWVRGPEMFERILTGIVLTTDPDAVTCWEVFYRQTIARLDAPRTSPSRGPVTATIEHYAPIYGHARTLTPPGSVLEVGCCFGFLSFLLAAEGRSVTVSDISGPTVELVAAVAARLGMPLTTLRADAARLPLPDLCVDTVHAIHLLEQLDPIHGDRALAEALRCARKRVVVAASLDLDPDESDGHVRRVTIDDLRTWGESLGHPFSVSEGPGERVGWLVVDPADRRTG